MLQHVSGSHIGIEGLTLREPYTRTLKSKISDNIPMARLIHSVHTLLHTKGYGPRKLLPYNRSYNLQSHAWQVTQRSDAKPLSVRNIIVRYI